MVGLWGFVRGLVVCAVIFVCLDASATPLFIGLGDLPGSTFESEAYAVADGGSTVVGQSKSNFSTWEAFRWTAETGMIGLGDLPGDVQGSRARAVSADGSVVGGDSRGETLEEAFLWKEASGMTRVWEGFGGHVRDLSADATVAAGGKAHQPVRWSETTGLEFLPILKTTSGTGVARGVSADGSILVGASDSDLGRQAFRWTESTGTVGLGDLPGGAFESEAQDVSADGLVAVGWGESSDGTEAFHWSAGEGMIGLGDLPGGIFHSEAWGASSDGSIIVGRATTASGAEAFMWTTDLGVVSLQGLLADDFGLNVAGWELLVATDISPDGLAITGYGTNPSGNREAWLARIPEPSSLLLFGFGLAALAILRQIIGGP